jgi:hypothetical protein
LLVDRLMVRGGGILDRQTDRGETPTAITVGLLVGRELPREPCRQTAAPQALGTFGRTRSVRAPAVAQAVRRNDIG